MIEEASAELLKNKGAIVNISSVAALIPSSNWGIYGVVKAAQDKLTTNLAFSVWAVLTRLCSWFGSRQAVWSPPGSCCTGERNVNTAVVIAVSCSCVSPADMPIC